MLGCCEYKEYEEIFMKKIVVAIAVLIGLSACSKEPKPLSDKVYDRSNSASEKSLESLDRDTK